MDPLQKQIDDLKYIVYNHRHKGFDRTKPLPGATDGSVSTLTDGTTVALDASLAKVFYLAAGGNRTISAPTNASPGKQIIIRHFASGGNRTLSLSGAANGFRFGTDVTGLSQTLSGKMDYIGCIWNEVDAFWDVVAVSKGY